MRYHGNYCGPGWSAGKYQPSVNQPEVSSIDEFDETCKVHDARYAKKDDLSEADFEFARANIGLNPKRTAAGMAVGIQGVARYAGLLPRRELKMKNGGFRNNYGTQGYELEQRRGRARLRGSVPKPVERTISSGGDPEASSSPNGTPGAANSIPAPLEAHQAKASNSFRPTGEYGTCEAKGTEATVLALSKPPDLQGKETNKAGWAQISNKNSLFQQSTLSKLRDKKNKMKNKNKNKNRGNRGRSNKQIDDSSKSTIIPVNSLQSVFNSAPIRTSKHSSNGETMMGRVYLAELSPVTKVDSTADNLALQALIPLAPAFWGNSYVANTTRFYEKYRIKKLRMHYLTSSATSTSGTLVLTHQSDPANELPNRNNDGSDLYTNLFSRANTLMGPVWENMFIDIPLTTTSLAWRYNDSKYGHTIEDCISGYLLCYSNVTASAVGRLALEFEIDFCDRANEISTANVPRSVGRTWTMSQAAASFGATGILTGASFSTAYGSPGAIVVAYPDPAASTLGTGPTDFNALYNYNGQQVIFGSGEAFYLRPSSGSTTNWNIYVSLEAAISGGAPLTIRNTTTTATTIIIMAYAFFQNPEGIS